MEGDTTQTNRSYIATFDAVRAIAVLMVFVTHSGILLHLPKPLEELSDLVRWSHFGVNLFFVLSGFLITRILIKSKGQKNAYKNFLIRRSLRIFPIYYLAILALMVIEPGQYLITSATYTSNYAFAFDETVNPMSHSWSLSVEEHFYLIWSPIVLFLSLKISRGFAFVIFPVISIVGTILTFAFLPEYAKPIFYRGTNYQMFALALGSALAFRESWVRTRWSRSLWTGAALIVSGIALILLLGRVFGTELLIRRFYSYSLISTGILCVFLSINDMKGDTENNAKGVLYRLATFPALMYIGRISYGLYLYHFPVYYFLGVFPPKYSTPISTIALGTGITFAIAIVSFQFIEKPILRLKSRFA